jgi:hypothetical protein
MSSPSLRLKNTRNWFAAGIEVQQALEILSDGAFKVFIYICLNAERKTGILHTTQVDLAKNLKKANGTIRKYLIEMEKAGVSQNHFSNNPVTRGSIQITSAYWPYEREADQPSDDDGTERFITEIKTLFEARACVQSSLSIADETLAKQWFHAGVPLDKIGQAILLGCSRKYVSWRNNQAVHGPITTLRYFEPLLDEIEKQSIDSDYWEFLQIRIRRYEKLWIEKHREEKESDPV